MFVIFTFFFFGHVCWYIIFESVIFECYNITPLNLFVVEGLLNLQTLLRLFPIEKAIENVLHYHEVPQPVRWTVAYELR